ncbi:MAG: rhomboid family intramembrane serine protease [Phycisphaerae bacterium]
MGWQDRDYAREYQAAAGPVVSRMRYRSPRSVVTILIWINVVVFVACQITESRSLSPLFVFCAMISEKVLHGQIWRLVTSDYLHWNFTHILMNMLGLYFLGRPLEQLWGPRRFFAVYTAAGVIGSLFYMILSLMGWLHSGIAAGASGCVLGLLGAAAVLFPHAEVYVYFLFPVKIRIVALVLGGFYVLNVLQGGPNAGGDACHLAGLAFGVWWAMKGMRWWDGRQRQRQRPQPVARVSFRQRLKQRRADAELIDRILAKVHANGVASLTDREKHALNEATARQQAEDRRFERTDRL